MVAPSSQPESFFQPRMSWRSTMNDEESRAYLQARLLVLSRLMFWSFVTFLVCMEALYALYPRLRPERDVTILIASATGLWVLATCWWVLRNRRLSISVLNQIDLLYAGGTGACFALGAFLAPDFQPAPYMCFMFTSLIVLTRSLIVPSSGRRTLALSTLAFTPYFFTATVFALDGWNGLPGLAILLGLLLVFTVVTLLATSGSRTLYGLRQQASAAMQLGQYTLQHKIGEGGMGVVYLANHMLLRRPTAIKLLLPDQIGRDTVDRFEREVQHMSQLTHPNSVAVFDYGRSFDGRFYYAMEYLDGIDLEDLVHEYGPLPIDRAVSIIVQICGALHEAHGRHLIHRDIKPANVILCERGAMFDVAKLLDYGLVKKIAASSSTDEPFNRDLTLDGESILGTPGYLAPEAIKAPNDIGPAADIYAVGAVAYYLLTGKRMFDGETAMAICVAHITKEPPPISRLRPIPAALEDLLISCVARSAADRPDAATLARKLRALPAVGDWSDERGAEWWREFRKQVRQTQLDDRPAALTVEIDFVQRASHQMIKAPQPGREADER